MDNCNMTDGDNTIQELVYFEPNLPTAKTLGVPESTFRAYADLVSREILKIVELDATEGMEICREKRGKNHNPKRNMAPQDADPIHAAAHIMRSAALR